ncbi:hypothetical protein [Paenibacillus ferrarius]|uniref:hypothetical protein n=1 Tax=Paenibacillus ferrarius TaxID=1469647 RepID=UPI003D26F151
MLKYSRVEMIFKLTEIRDEEGKEDIEVLASRIADILDVEILSYEDYELTYRTRNHLRGAIYTAHVINLRDKLSNELKWHNWIRIMLRYTYGSSFQKIGKFVL